jgi:dihydrolipoamide dehydrogenase
MDKRGFIEVNDRLATNVPGIYAIGDVTGKLLLAHVASTMAVAAAENIAGVETTILDYRMMPRAVFSIHRWLLLASPKPRPKSRVMMSKLVVLILWQRQSAGLGEVAGFAKIITDAKYGEILGAVIVGPEASELLPELTLAQRSEMTAEELPATCTRTPPSAKC